MLILKTLTKGYMFYPPKNSEMDHFTRQSNGMYFNLAYEMVPTQSHVSSILQFTTPPTVSHPTYKIALGKPSVSSTP